MGKKSNVNRLPKAERTNPTSKITVQPAEPMVWVRDPMEVSLPHQPTKPERPVPTLDDESLNKILNLAGVTATLRARSVNNQWRRVATDILNRVHFIELSRLFPSIPTPAIVQSTLTVFSHAEGINIRNWPYTHVYPCIVDELLIAELPRLREVELHGVYLTPKTIGTLIQQQSVRCLSLGDHDSINRAVVSAMTKAQSNLFQGDRREARRRANYLLDRLVFKRARCLEGEDISLVSDYCIAQDVVAMSCPNVRHISRLVCKSLSTSRSQQVYETYSITNCRNLQNVELIMDFSSNDLSELNLSQCTELRHINFTAENSHQFHFGTLLTSDLRELNLSGCRQLGEITIGNDDPVTIVFPKLERLILFGARRLRRECIQNGLGLSRSIPFLPKLVRLDLNGTMIDKLVLNDYSQLMWVDVSGCQCLDSIDVRECWQLQSFSVLGKRAPLNTVNMILPVTCRVDGKRDSWRWQTQGSHQAISYP